MKRPIAALLLLLASVACAPDTQPPSVDEPPLATAPVMSAEPEPGTEKGAREFATAFLQARMARDERLARTSLSPTALDQYGKGEGGLALVDPEVTTWDFVSVQAADANSYEVKVAIWERTPDQSAETSFTETLFVGPGPDAQGRQRPWIIRGATRSPG